MSEERRAYRREWSRKKRNGTFVPKAPRFTKEEDAYILKHFGTQPVQQIADWLGRPRVSIYSRAQVLGLRDVPCRDQEAKGQFTRYWYMKNQRVFARAMSEALERGEF